MGPSHTIGTPCALRARRDPLCCLVCPWWARYPRAIDAVVARCACGGRCRLCRAVATSGARVLHPLDTIGPSWAGYAVGVHPGGAWCWRRGEGVAHVEGGAGGWGGRPLWAIGGVCLAELGYGCRIGAVVPHGAWHEGVGEPEALVARRAGCWCCGSLWAIGARWALYPCAC